MTSMTILKTVVGRREGLRGRQATVKEKEGLLMNKGIKGSLNKRDYKYQGRNSLWRGLHLYKKIKIKASWEVVWNIKHLFFFFFNLESSFNQFISKMVQKEKLGGETHDIQYASSSHFNVLFKASGGISFKHGENLNRISLGTAGSSDYQRV